MTEFEKEIINSMLWQIKGFCEGHVSERATKRIMRASLRRITAKKLGCSVNAYNLKSGQIDTDHIVPIKVIVEMLMKCNNISKQKILGTLHKYYYTVDITRHEHTVILKNLDLESNMPEDWDGEELMARYKHSSIEIKTNN